MLKGNFEEGRRKKEEEEEVGRRGKFYV